jgi:RNA polymerase sigma factor (sigma-70 family)
MLREQERLTRDASLMPKLGIEERLQRCIRTAPTLATEAATEVNGSAAFQKFFSNEIELAKLSICLAVIKGRYVPTRTPSLEEADSSLDDAIQPEVKTTSATLAPTSPALDTVFKQTLDLEPILCRYLFQDFGISAHEGQEIVSESYLGLFKFIINNGIDPASLDRKSLHNLMRTLTKRRGVDLLRETRGKKGQRPPSITLPIEEAENDYSAIEKLGPSFYQSYTDTVEEKIDTEARAKRIKKLLPMLTEQQRRVFVLHAYFDLSLVEIQQVLNKKALGTVHALSTQAIQKLRELLSE